MSLSMLICAGALASPGSAGAIHLGSLPLPAGTAYVGGGVGVGHVLGLPLASPALEVGAALGDRFALAAIAGADLLQGAAFPAHASLRWVAIEQENLRFALVVSETVIPTPTNDALVETHTSPGFALDTGGEKVRFDAAVPLWGVSTVGAEFGPERFPVPALCTAGVNVQIDDHHRVRVGWPEFVSYHYRANRFYLDVGGGTLLLTSSLWLKLGAVL